MVIDNLPVAEEAKRFAEKHDLNPVDLCLYGGEEYELVVTVKANKWEEATKATPLTPIGLVTEERTLLLEEKGKRTLIEPKGWEHFKTSPIGEARREKNEENV